MKRVFFFLAFLAGLLAAQESLAQSVNSTIKLNSRAFQSGETIPDEYTCKGINRSPSLSWRGVPAAAQSLALIVEDPDAPKGTHTHWIAFNMPANQHELPASLPAAREGDKFQQGKNDSNVNGYSGPCPPAGHGQHRYFFRLYALDITLPLASGAGKEEIKKALEGHVLAEGELMGRYEVK